MNLTALIKELQGFRPRKTRKTDSLAKIDQTDQIAKAVTVCGRNLYGSPRAGMPYAIRDSATFQVSGRETTVNHSTIDIRP